MKHLKKYKLFESVDSDLEDIRDIMNDIPDLEDNIDVVVTDKPSLYRFPNSSNNHIFIDIRPLKEYFKVNQNIKSVIQRLNHLYRNDYTFVYQYMDGFEWIKFNVYDDIRGLRDSYANILDGSGKFPSSVQILPSTIRAPKIYRMQIVMTKK